MKRDEELALEYLVSLDRGSVVFEPDGNVPPDFLIDGRIAVEVRRLNQNYVINGKTHGFENDRISFISQDQGLSQCSGACS